MHCLYEKTRAVIVDEFCDGDCAAAEIDILLNDKVPSRWCVAFFYYSTKKCKMEQGNIVIEQTNLRGYKRGTGRERERD